MPPAFRASFNLSSAAQSASVKSLSFAAPAAMRASVKEMPHKQQRRKASVAGKTRLQLANFAIQKDMLWKSIPA